MRCLSLLLLVSAALFGQVDTGIITGSVRDQSGAAIPGAAVSITEVATNNTVKATSDAQGNYVSRPLHAGTYAVTAEAPGFKVLSRDNVVLQVQDRLRVDFDMQVGNVSEKVQVMAETPAVETETSSLGQVVTAQQVTGLPLNGRNYLNLATLTAGVADTSSGNNNGNEGGAFVANGTRGTLNNFMLDGVDNNSNDNGWAVLRTSVDAIQEFKVQTNSYSAEFGRSGGAVINAILKSGTNQFHGSAFEFLRNSVFDARDYFEAPGTNKASFQQNQFGGTLGGPIVRDRLFFFGDYQGTRIHNPLTYVSSVPTLAQRTGDFSGPGNNVIYDPRSYDPVTGARQPFQGNVIPTQFISPIAQAYMNLYPAPNIPGKLRNNYVISPADLDDINQFDARLDYNISARDQIFARASWASRTNQQPSPLPGLANGGNSSTGYTYEDTQGGALGSTHTFTPTLVNEFRAGINHVHIDRGIPFGGTQFPPPELQVPGVANNPSTNGLTLFSPNGFRRLGDPGFAPTLLASRETQINDSVALVRGRQTIKIGGEMRWSQFNIFQVSRPRGAFNFSGQFTRNPADPDGTGSSLADMLLGIPNTSTISSLTQFGNRQKVASAFVQDDFKASPSLTLNLGLRYDYATPLVEVHDRQANFDYSTGQIVVAGQNGASRGLTTVDKANFAPRVGFAWSPFSAHRTVFRGAYGMFYSPQEIRTAGGLQLAYNVPFFYEPSFISDGITPALTVQKGFPALNPQLAVDPPVTSVDMRSHTPYYQHWNFGIEQQATASLVLSVAYAGSKGTHLQVVTDQNQVALPGPGDVQSRRPYPTFGVFTAIQNRGNSDYHSLQLKADKRLSKGLLFLSAFTWSKAMNDLPEICCSSPWPQNSYNLRAERGLADFDQRVRWVTSFDYELPFGRGRRWMTQGRAADLVFGGWYLSGIFALSSGFPFSPLIGYDPSNTGSIGLVRANRIGNGNLPSDQRSPDLYFDPNAFTIPDDYTFGNSGRNVLIGPGSITSNASVRKQFAVTERQRLEFRAEFFNLLNHPNFAQPDNFIDDGPGSTGVITSLASPMRQVQFALKYIF